MKKVSKKALLIFTVVSALFVASFAIVYAESISSVISAIVQRATIAFESIGQNTVETSGKDMENSGSITKTSINGIINNAEEDLSNELEQYKNMKINEKNQELESLLRDADASITQKKAEKLDEYKQKIDERINKEYEKLLNDLTLN